MPNVNLLPTITTSTDNKSYFIVSDNGLVRRFKYENLITQIQQSIPDANRTDQNLFTTTDVTFRSLTLHDIATTANSGTDPVHGLQLEMTNSTGSAIKTNDILGTIRFGGWDGMQYVIRDGLIASAGINAAAAQNWSNNGSTTTSAASALQLFYQPVNTRLERQSRVTTMFVTSTQTNFATNPTTIVRIGAVPTTSTVVTTSADGNTAYQGLGRADVSFLNSRVQIIGLPGEDTTAPNATLTGTNSLTFSSGRGNIFIGHKQPVKADDTLGVIQFNGINQASQGPDIGVPGVIIRAHSTCDFTNQHYGAGLHVRMMSSLTNTIVLALDLQPEGNNYNSAYHKFSDVDGNNSLTVSSGTIIFGDQSIQTTAYPGFTSVPGSSNTTGTPGQMAHDSSYVYICVAPNQWKRIAASDF